MPPLPLQNGLPHAGGLLLVGHGSREPDGVEEFLATARLVADRAAPTAVEPCFLEFAQPSIAEGLATLAARGFERVTVAPLLLFSAGHAERDIPAAVAAAAQSHPRIAVEQCAHLGCHELLLELSAARYQQALALRPPVAPGETVLVMVGRGSRDSGATAEMHQFVRRRHELTPAAQARTAFLAMAEPSLKTVLDEVAHFGARRVVIQPHILFTGVLLERMRGTVNQFARRYRQLDWLSVPHLGPSELVARAVLDRAGALSNV